MKRLLKSHIALLAWRLALLYAVLAICRAIFWRYNYAGIGPLADAELPALARGALLFDTVSVLYANALLIVLSLIPLHLRERRWWQRMLYFYYVVVNALLVVAVNLGDAVYFRYTQKRFTAEEIFFADNDNSLQLVGKFMAENIPLLLAGIGLIALLALAGGRKARPEPLCRRPLCYYGGGTVLLVVAALLSVAGMRGGVTRMTRPVTLSNATLYASDNARANLILSNPFCILRTVGSGGKISYERYFAPEELDGIYTPVHRPGSVGAAPLEGRNVVVFVMESMSAEHSALLHPELYADRQVKGYTPFLDSLMQAGYCFERMYANGTRSIQALPAVLGSIPSFKTPFVLMPQALAPTRQLPRRKIPLRRAHPRQRGAATLVCRLRFRRRLPRVLPYARRLRLRHGRPCARPRHGTAAHRRTLRRRDARPERSAAGIIDRAGNNPSRSARTPFVHRAGGPPCASHSR